MAAAAGDAVGAAPPAAAAARGGEEGGWLGGLQGVVRTIFLFMAVQNVAKTFFGPGPASFSSSSSTSSSSLSGSGRNGFDGHATEGLYRGPLIPLWRKGTPMSLRVYLSPCDDFDHGRDHPGRLVWEEGGLSYDWAEGNGRQRSLNVSRAAVLGAQANASSATAYYAHVVFTRTDFPFNPDNPHLHTYTRVALIALKPRPKNKALRSLLDSPAPSASEQEKATGNATDTAQQCDAVATKAEEVEPDPSAAATAAVANASATTNHTITTTDMVPFWKPSLALHLVHHFEAWPRLSQLPPFIAEKMAVDPATGFLWPVLYPSEFWLLKEHLVSLENDSVDTLRLDLSYAPIGFFKWQIQLQMDQAFEAQRQGGMAGEGEADTIKRMLLETNPILLAVTFIVSLLHMLFDMLAVKNDVAFWRKAKSLEGVSLRTMALNAFFHVVIFLYLLDNDTSWMVLLSSGMSLVVDIWKVHKGLVASLVWADPRTGRAYRIPRVTVEAVASYSKSKTQQYDEEATKHLMYIVVPLMAGYAAYSLVHERHKSWYSWAVTSLTGFVYVFGFVMMTPQLYINYKLKSVSHLPWRTMVYKALNTFIDDLFAFIIKMPTMHRLSCFRDDIIFFIMLYQRYIYPVDSRRLGDMDDGEGGEAAAPLVEEEQRRGREEGPGPRAEGTVAVPLSVGRGEEEGEEGEEEEEGEEAAAPLLAEGGRSLRRREE